MLLAGDEFRRTQRGNNNAYCQDNEVTWLDWTLRERHRELDRFTREMLAFRRAHPVLSREAFYTDAEVRWFGPNGQLPEWGDPYERHLGCMLQAEAEPDLLLLFNAGAETTSFCLPQPRSGRSWYRAIDTALVSPRDIAQPGHESLLDDSASYRVGAMTSVVLIAQ